MPLAAGAGRAGRLKRNPAGEEKPLQPYVDMNIWRNFDGKNDVTFNDRTIATGLEGNSIEFGTGLSTQVAQNVSLYGGVKYTTDISGPENRGVGGMFGLRVKW